MGPVFVLWTKCSLNIYYIKFIILKKDRANELMSVLFDVFYFGSSSCFLSCLLCLCDSDLIVQVQFSLLCLEF